MTRCLACHSFPLTRVLDLGAQVPANAFHDGSAPQPRTPLVVLHCPTCDHAQLDAQIPPRELFTDYPFQSGVGETARRYFHDFASRVVADYDRPPRVLELACNDGTLLREFAASGCYVVGVDPARNLTTANAVTGYWPQVAGRVAIGGPFDVIVAMNVLAHVPDPYDFLTPCQEQPAGDGANVYLDNLNRVLAPGGTIYVQTSQAHWRERGEFDCVYHEHVSYFTPESMRALCRRVGLVLVGVEEVPVHGGSWLFTIKQRGVPAAVPARVPWHSIAVAAPTVASRLRRYVDRQRRAGHAVYGYGACAKGNVLLQWADVTLDGIVDETPTKQGLLSPGMNIPIASPLALINEARPVSVIVLAWNWFEEIAAKVRRWKPEAEVVRMMGGES